ncbi:MAG: YggS family pyridoxal phosphate-dependent enzyme [Caldilineae bacterium]|nr:MAG: YggS family pyridoxal phosphate-dependent enzyme [Caldilineae bacterium]
MIAENLARVQRRIARAAERAGRHPADITLVGVTKTRPVAAMLEAYRAGLRHFGENRVEEMAEKTPPFLSATDPADPPVMHMIGHLQSRKVAAALQHAQLIHSVDTLKLAQRIDRLARRDGHPPVPVLLECNISGEATKAGFRLAGWEKDSDVREAFLRDVAAMLNLSHLRVQGLMTMAPIVADPEETRPIFRSLRCLLTLCAERFPQADWQHLSMGMTDDFEVAVEEGATFVRVGRAIFD